MGKSFRFLRELSSAEALKNTLVRFPPFLWNASPGLLTLVIVLRLLGSAGPALQIYLTKELVDEAARLISTQSTNYANAALLLLLQGCLIFANVGLDSASRKCLFLLKLRAGFQLDRAMAEKSSRLPLIYFEQPDYYDQLQKSTQSLNFRGLHIIDVALSLLQNVVTIGSLIAVLGTVHYSLALVMMGFAIVTLVAQLRIGQRKYKQMIVQTPSQRKVGYLMSLMTGKEAAKEIRLFNIFSFIANQWERLYWKNADEKYALEKRTEQNNFMLGLLSGTIQLASISLMLYIGSKGKITLGYYVAVTQALASVQGMMTNMAYNLSKLYEEALFLNEIYRFLDMPEENEAVKDKLLAFPLQKGIEVKGLSFSYPSNEKKVLNNISFHIKPGQKVAIVGENGSGKSTLVKCLIGLYRPGNGTILYDDMRMEEIRDLRRHVSAMFQDFVCYQLTARENIGVGNIELMEDRAALETAAANAHADVIVKGLAQGYDTQLGPQFFGGHELSNGQWQKMALGRAFFRKAELVVLDEPTAALDPMAEAALFEHFAQLSEQKTTLMISHRLGICRYADHILVLKEGVLVEEGSHEYLMDIDGEYARMFRTQSKWYERADAEVGAPSLERI